MMSLLKKLSAEQDLSVKPRPYFDHSIEPNKICNANSALKCRKVCLKVMMLVRS